MKQTCHIKGENMEPLLVDAKTVEYLVICSLDVLPCRCYDREICGL